MIISSFSLSELNKIQSVGIHEPRWYGLARTENYLSESTRTWLVDCMLGLEDMLEEIGFILSFELDEI